MVLSSATSTSTPLKSTSGMSRTSSSSLDRKTSSTRMTHATTVGSFRTGRTATIRLRRSRFLRRGQELRRTRRPRAQRAARACLFPTVSDAIGCGSRRLGTGFSQPMTARLGPVHHARSRAGRQLSELIRVRITPLPGARTSRRVVGRRRHPRRPARQQRARPVRDAITTSALAVRGFCRTTVQGI